MKKYLKNKKGMLVLVLAAGLFFVAITFAGITNRMRGEALITNRVSVNERLSQLAAAIGRVSIRKLQKYITLRDDKFGKDIQLAFIDEGINNEKLKTITEKASADFTKRVNSMKVVKDLKKDFKDRWGDQGTPEVSLIYKVVLTDETGFGDPINGVSGNPYEHKGYISVIVTLTLKSGVKRTYEVRKEFIFVRLLAAPFYRFTLFSHYGANIKDKVANSIKYTEYGSVVEDEKDINQQLKRPLVCLNRRITDNDYCREARHYKENPLKCIKDNPDPNLKGANAFIKNGWIYLGGQGLNGSTKKDDNDKYLMLNIVPGNSDDGLKSKFGEFFHFYWNPGNKGWLVLDSNSGWENKLRDKLGAGQLSVCYVKYGIYNGLIDHAMPFENTDFTHLKNYNLFNLVPEFYNVSVHNNTILDANNEDSPAYSIKKSCGSAIHLFGSPNVC